MSVEGKDNYFVALKVFLKKGGRFLILKDKFGDWDLPGGRIRKDEFETPLEQIIARKMSEEIGSDVRYRLEEPVVFMRHERVENAPGSPTVRIFAVGYEATLQSGEVRLSGMHNEILWVDPKNFQPEKYFKGGWLRGVEEYLKIERIFPSS